MYRRTATACRALALPWCLLLISSLLAPQSLGAQQSKDPLTAAEEEQVRAASDDPSERVKLYIRFIQQRTDAIHATVQHPRTQHPGAEIHTSLEQFTRLVDELGDNLDAYDQAHTDIRKGLKVLVERSARWPAALQEPAASDEFDFVRRNALEAAGNLSDQAAQLLKAQETYFAKQKAPKK